MFCVTANEGKPLSEVEYFEEQTNKWMPLSPMPHPHCSCAYLLYNHKLHVIGGLSVGGATNVMDALSVAQ